VRADGSSENHEDVVEAEDEAVGWLGAGDSVGQGFSSIGILLTSDEDLEAMVS
jgi:hypothetical protein